LKKKIRFLAEQLKTLFFLPLTLVAHLNDKNGIGAAVIILKMKSGYCSASKIRINKVIRSVPSFNHMATKVEKKTLNRKTETLKG
jgi:hypothetical protein